MLSVGFSVNFHLLSDEKKISRYCRHSKRRKRHREQHRRRDVQFVYAEPGNPRVLPHEPFRKGASIGLPDDLKSPIYDKPCFTFADLVYQGERCARCDFS